MKEYYITDKDGKKKIIEKDNGITIEILEEPSQEYLNKLVAIPPEPQGNGLDLVKAAQELKEIDKLKADIEKLNNEVKKLKETK